jgi:hypothetical protein
MLKYYKRQKDRMYETTYLSCRIEGEIKLSCGVM